MADEQRFDSEGDVEEEKKILNQESTVNQWLVKLIWLHMWHSIGGEMCRGMWKWLENSS